MTISQWLEILLNGDDLAAAGLECYREQAVPAVLEALRRDRRAKNPAAIAGLCRVLMPYAPREAESLAEQLPQLQGEARKSVIGLLVRIGSERAIAAVTVAAQDPDPTRSLDAEEAIWKALIFNRNKPGDRAVVTSLFDTLASRVTERTGHPLFQIAETLVVLDPMQAAELLGSPQMLRVDNPRLRDILRAVHRQRVVLPAGPLIALVPWIMGVTNRGEEKREECEICQYLLPAIAHAAPEVAGSLIRDRMDYPPNLIRWGIYESYAILHGVDQALPVVTRKVYVTGEDGQTLNRFNDLPRPEQVYWVCFSVDAQVCNGGFEQFFFNCPDLMPHAPSALREIGATRRAELMYDALAAFRPDAPDAAPPRDFDSAYYDMKDEWVLDLLILYAAKHAELFRA